MTKIDKKWCKATSKSDVAIYVALDSKKTLNANIYIGVAWETRKTVKKRRVKIPLNENMLKILIRAPLENITHPAHLHIKQKY